MPLDSDTPNADAQLHVEFYTYNEDGPWKGIPHVRIMTPGDKNNIVQRPVRESDKRRFVRQWLHFQSESTDHLVVGTPLSVWRKERPDELTENQFQELMILKFQSVEQLAMATDTQVMRMGMGAMGLRQRAHAYLTSKNAQASGAELEKAKDELLMLKSSMERMQAQMLAMQSAPPKEETFRAGSARRGGKRGGYRPRKPKVEVNEQQHAPATGATGL